MVLAYVILGLVTLPFLGLAGRNLWHLRDLPRPPGDPPVDERIWAGESLLMWSLFGVGLLAGGQLGLHALLEAATWRETIRVVLQPWRAPVPWVIVPVFLSQLIWMFSHYLYGYRQSLTDLPGDLDPPVLLTTPCKEQFFGKGWTPPSPLIVTPSEIRILAAGEGAATSIPLESVTRTRVTGRWRVLFTGMYMLTVEREDAREWSGYVARVREVRDAIERARLGELEAPPDGPDG